MALIRKSAHVVAVQVGGYSSYQFPTSQEEWRGFWLAFCRKAIPGPENTQLELMALLLGVCREDQRPKVRFQIPSLNFVYRRRPKCCSPFFDLFSGPLPFLYDSHWQLLVYKYSIPFIFRFIYKYIYHNNQSHNWYVSHIAMLLCRDVHHRKNSVRFQSWEFTILRRSGAAVIVPLSFFGQPEHCQGTGRLNYNPLN
jgi:hypothetical protein